MSPFRLATAAALAAGLAFGTAARAAILLSDDFENDYLDTVTNVGSLSNWTVSNGSVDYLKNYAGISCFGGSSGCLDMDGSTNDAGRITSSATFLIEPNVTYRLSVRVSGSQRSGLDGFAMGLIDVDNGGVDWLTISETGIEANFPFLEYGFDTTHNVAAFNARIFIEGVGGDNVGVILDNVVFSTVSETPGQGVDSPAPLLLAGAGLLAAGLVGRRRRRA